MLTDAQLAFIPIGGNQSMVAGAGVNIASVNTLDLLGQGVGTAPANIIGNPSSGLFGEDIGVGDVRPYIDIVVGTAFTTGTGCTLNVALQTAPDTAVTYLPGAWTTIVETGAIAVANLTANQVIRLQFDPVFPANQVGRYLRLLFQVPSGDDFTAGTISSALVTLARDDLNNKNAARNYVVH